VAVTRVKVAKQRFEIGLRPAEADKLALELAKMEIERDEPDFDEMRRTPELDKVRLERRAWLAVAMPSHEVEVGPFEIDVFPVTNAQWADFGASLPARIGEPNAFVTGVSWEEATAYARFRGGELPTEQEWEVAARGDRRLFTWGDNYGPQGDVAFTPPVLETYRVGSRGATAAKNGVQDLLGQFGEYTSSPFGPYPGADLAQFEKLYPRWKGQVVQRGGYDVHQDATCVSRRGVPINERRTHIKFRCVYR
jgi:formylglycine-generating enzyme required for sulfatase activity